VIRHPAPARPAALLRAIGLAVALTVTFALVACGDTGPGTRPEPIAAAGSDRTVAVGTFVVLDGRASQHADAFAWSFVARPSGSAAAIADADEALAGFLADAAGTFEVALDVSGPGGTDRDTLTVIAGPEGEMLTPGGILFGEDGVALAALPGALELAIEVFVTAVPAPEAPLPPGSTVLGPFVLLGSPDDVAAAANPFLVALPVPEEADTARLAMAALLVPDDVTGTYLSEPAWELIAGAFEPRGGYFVTTLAGLPAGGRVVTLVASDDAASPTLGTLPAGVATLQSEPFTASCRNFNNPLINNLGIGCSPADEADLEAVMTVDYLDLVAGLGFRGPNLPRSFDLAQTAINLVEGEIDVVFGPYEVQLRPYRSVAQDADTWPCGIRPDGSGNGGGYSFGLTTSLFVCIDDDGLYDPFGSPKPAVATARHELFHAIQFAYPNVGDGSRGRDLWIIEGTAVASEFSSATMQRSTSFNPRVVEVGLTVAADLAHYRAQDFFVFAGQSLGLGLDYLQAVFARGARTRDVDAALTSLGVTGGLSETYWRWARYQAMADASVAGSTVLCAPQPGRVTPEQLSFDLEAPAQVATATVPSLAARLFELTFTADPAIDYFAQVVIAPDRTGAARAVVYDGGCGRAVETDRLAVAVEAGKDKTVVVLVANVVTDDRMPHLGIEVTANVWPTVHIESPRDGGWYRAENPLPLRAVITGADAGVRARPVDWWVRVVSPDTQWRLASSSGETLHFRTVDAYCDADVEVEAVVDPGALIAEIGLLTDFRRVALGGRSPGPLRAVVTAPTRPLHHLELRESLPGVFELAPLTLRGIAAQRRCGADGLADATASWLDAGGLLLAQARFEVAHPLDPAVFDDGSGGWRQRWFRLRAEHDGRTAWSSVGVAPCYGREDDDLRLPGVPPCPAEVDGFWYDLDQAFDTLQRLPTREELLFALDGPTRTLEGALGLEAFTFPFRDDAVIGLLDVDLAVRAALQDLHRVVAGDDLEVTLAQLAELDERVRTDEALVGVDTAAYLLASGLVRDALEAFGWDALDGSGRAWASFGFVRDTDGELLDVDPVAPARGALQGFLTSATRRAVRDPVHLRAATLAALVFAAEELGRAGY